MSDMATREQIRDAMHQQPFRGLTIKLTDGWSFTVHHPDFIAVPATERERDIIVHDREWTYRIDLRHIVEVGSPNSGEPASKPKRKAGRT